MKQILTSRRILLLFLASLSFVSADNLDNVLRYRQIVPKGTGASASITSVTLTPTSSEALESPISSKPGSNTSKSPPTTSDAPVPVLTSTTPSETEDASSTLISSKPPNPQTQLVSTADIQSVTDVASSSETPLTTAAPVSPGRTKPVSIQVVSSTVVIVDGGTSVTNVITSTGIPAAPGSAQSSKGAPKLDGNEDNSSSSGLKPSEKRVIIGTVVGIGGAILLGGIAVVVWRIWGKRRHVADDDRDLMDSAPGSSGREKRSSISGNNPFQSTLDQYHNPAGPVNTASNF